jgi:hypothetical protein
MMQRGQRPNPVHLENRKRGTKGDMSGGRRHRDAVGRDAVIGEVLLGAEIWRFRLVDEIADAAALRDYAPLPSARGDFRFRAGR